MHRYEVRLAIDCLLTSARLTMSTTVVFCLADGVEIDAEIRGGQVQYIMYEKCSQAVNQAENEGT